MKMFVKFIFKVEWRDWLLTTLSEYTKCSVMQNCLVLKLSASVIDTFTKLVSLSLSFFLLMSIRSSRPDVFYKKGVLRNFAKLTGKHLCQSLFFNKVVGLACNLIKEETLAQVFSCGFCEISKNTFSFRTPPVAASRVSLSLYCQKCSYFFRFVYC